MDLFPPSPAKEGLFKDSDKVGIGFASQLEKGFSVGMGGLYDTVLEGVGKIRDSLERSYTLIQHG